MTTTIGWNGNLDRDPAFAMFELGNLCMQKLDAFVASKHEWLTEVLEQAQSMCSGKKETRPFPVTPRKRKWKTRNNQNEQDSPSAKRHSERAFVASVLNEDTNETNGNRRTTRACKKRAASKIQQQLDCTSNSEALFNTVPEVPTPCQIRRKISLPTSDVSEVLQCSEMVSEQSGMTYPSQSENNSVNTINGERLVANTDAHESVNLNETSCGRQLPKQKSFVQEQVKAFEEKICTGLLEETPRKVKQSLALVLETSSMVEARHLSIASTDNSRKTYVSVLTPLTLSAKKKLLSAVVICSPLKLFLEPCKELKENRRSSVRRSRRLTNVRHSTRLSSRLSTATHSLRSIFPPSKRRTSVMLSKIRSSLEQNKRRSRAKPNEFSELPSNSSGSKNTTTEIDDKHIDLDNSAECKENHEPNNQMTSQGSDTDEKGTPPSTDVQDDDEYDDDDDDDDDVIATTPSPKCPKNKVICTKQLSKKRSNFRSGGMITRSIRTVAAQSSEDRKQIARIPKKSFTPSGKRAPMTPLSANRANGAFTPHSQNRFPFGRSNYQSPMTQEMHIRGQQKLKEIQLKEAKEKEILRMRQEKLKQKLEEQKRKRDARMQRALEARQQKDRELLEMQQRLEREQEEKLNTKERQREEKLRQESLKKSQYLKQKTAEAIARRKQEEEARLQKLKEQEEEQLRYQQMLQRKKEYEEQERIKQKQLELQRQREFEKEMRQIKEKELVQLKEIEALKQKIAKNGKETKKLAQEREIVCHPTEDDNEVSIISVNAADTTFNVTQLTEKNVNHLNSTYNKSPTETNENIEKALNSTFNKPATVASNDNYEITPERNRSFQAALKNPDNYDISLLCSDDSTDDESHPRKQVPSWASGIQLRSALIVLMTKPPNLDELFPPFDMPDLSKIFKKKRTRYMQRTSSAIWNSPIQKHDECD